MTKEINRLATFDPTKVIERMRKKHEIKIVSMVICKLFPDEKIDGDMLTVAMERIKFHSLDVYTIRYKGEVVLRRYVNDLMGWQFRYESPIFSNSDKQGINQ